MPMTPWFDDPRRRLTWLLGRPLHGPLLAAGTEESELSCAEVRRHLHAGLPDLDAATLTAVERHVDGCAACAAETERLVAEPLDREALKALERFVLDEVDLRRTCPAERERDLVLGLPEVPARWRGHLTWCFACQEQRDALLAAPAFGGLAAAPADARPAAPARPLFEVGGYELREVEPGLFRLSLVRPDAVELRDRRVRLATPDGRVSLEVQLSRTRAFRLAPDDAARRAALRALEEAARGGTFLRLDVLEGQS